jgi:hypothetical protein
MSRPAEAAGAGAGGLAAILIATLGLSAGAAAAVAAVAGIVPAAVTWLVHHGGLRGAIRSLWRGSDTHA